MSKLVTVDVDVDISGIEDHFQELCQDPTLKLTLHNMLAKKCDPYVPFLEGYLSQTLEITPEYVRYTMPYAHYQYYGTWFKHTLEHHPLASAMWDQAMLADKREEFEAEVKAALVRRYRELYGD